MTTLRNRLAALLALAAVLPSPSAPAQDLNARLLDDARPAHYFPDGKYHLFGPARGSVANVRYSVKQFHGTASGPLLPVTHERHAFEAELDYDTKFSNHGHEVHAPFDQSNARSISLDHGDVYGGGLTVYRLNYTGHRHHPADGYDGPQGGGYPAPKGARDEYSYRIKGTSTTTRINPPSDEGFWQRYWRRNAGVIPEGISRHEEAGRLMTDYSDPVGIWGQAMQAVRGLVTAGGNFLITGLDGAAAATGLSTGVEMAAEHGGQALARSLFDREGILGGEGSAAAVGRMQDSAFAVRGLTDSVREAAAAYPGTAETAKTALSVAEAAAAAAGRRVDLTPGFDGIGKGAGKGRADGYGHTDSHAGAGGQRTDIDSSNSPIEPYNRQKHYGGSQTNSPAAQAAREAGEGQPCPTCGQTMLNGTPTAPSPQHDPALSTHYYEYGGHSMTNEERKKYAREEGINGAQCLTCQRREGARQSRYTREQNRKYGLK